jgi:hypothetical protein
MRTKFQLEDFCKEENSEYLGVGGRIILKWTVHRVLTNVIMLIVSGCRPFSKTGLCVGVGAFLWTD